MRFKAVVVLFLLPTLAHASGGDILGLFWLEVVLFVGVLAVLLTTRAAVKCKLSIFVAYILSVIASLWFTEGLPYLKNLVLVNSICFFVPLATTVVAWRWCAKRSQA